MIRIAGIEREGGFTLLELLVVLAIISLALGLVTPSLMHWRDRATARAWRADLGAYITALPVRAYAGGETLTVDAASLRAVMPALPEQVSIALETPLRYSSSGVAAGGLVVIQDAGGAREEWRIAPWTGELAVGGNDAPPAPAR